jgi:hypothetical protein
MKPDIKETIRNEYVHGYLTLDRFNRVLGRYSLRFGTAV